MKQHRRMFAVALFVAAVSTYATTMSACATDSIDINNPTWQHNSQTDFDEYGLMLRDAGSASSTCAQNAALKLNAKLAKAETDDGANYAANWQGFLSGAYVTLILATGMEAGGKGNMFPALDQRLYRVAKAYQFNFALDPNGAEIDPCGITAFDVTAGKTSKHRSRRANSCMDDHTIAVGGYGWVAAYLRLSGRSYIAARNAAIDHTHKSLGTYDSICVHSPSAYSAARMSDSEPEICNGSISSLGTSDYRLLSLNHGNETPAYGFGLLTSMAAGFRGLKAAQIDVTELTTDDKTVLQYLWKEAADHTDSNGVFHNYSPNNNGDCQNVENAMAGNRTLAGSWGCEDQQYFYGDSTESAGSSNSAGDTLSASTGYRGYKAKWYPLSQFYSDYGLTKGNNSGWAFNSSEDSFYTSAGQFFGPARRETYLTLAYDWYVNATPQLTAGSEFRMAVKTATGNFFTATNGGGSSMYATDTNQDDAYSTFRLLDLNGAILGDGDPVALRITSGTTDYFMVAESGGNDVVNINRTSIGPWETFTIVKVSDVNNSPGGVLNDGDKFALRSYAGYYVTPVNGGGSSVNATATSIGSAQTFVYTKTESTYY